MRPDASPTARALLALELIQAGPGITAERLAGRLGVTQTCGFSGLGRFTQSWLHCDSRLETNPGTTTWSWAHETI